MRDLFLKFMGLTFISYLVFDVWNAATFFGQLGGATAANSVYVKAVTGLMVCLTLTVYGSLVWLFLFRTDSVARKLWPRSGTVGVVPIAGDSALTLGFVILLFGLHEIIPGLADLLSQIGYVTLSSLTPDDGFTQFWVPLLRPLSAVLIGAVCIRWPHRIESLIVRGWETRSIFHIDVDDGDGDEPDGAVLS
ncbi:MAG: hypothetical protein ABI780_04545 [Ardenticatenales bacterium]